MSWEDDNHDITEDLARFGKWLAGPFRRAAERKQARRLEKHAAADRKAYYQEICKTIDTDDAPKIKLMLENPPVDKKTFMKEYGWKLLEYAALEHGSLTSFIPVYHAINTPNLYWNESWYANQTSWTGKHPLICKVIEAHKSDIAAYMAKDPAVDITVKRHYTGKTPYDLAKEIMDKGEGMKDVVAILSERIALMKSREADQLLAQAAKLKDTPGI